MAKAAQARTRNGRADDGKADAVGQRVAEKVERVRLQRLRSGERAGAHLDEEHRGIDGDDGPQPAFVVRRQAFEIQEWYRNSPRPSATSIRTLQISARPEVTQSHAAAERAKARLLQLHHRLAADQARKLAQADEHPLAGEVLAGRCGSAAPGGRARPPSASSAARRWSRRRPDRRRAAPRPARARGRARGSRQARACRGDSSSSTSPTWRKNTASAR